MYEQAQILLDVTIALILGGILGLEREWKQKPAGFRTNMIISGSAALLVSLGRIGISIALKQYWLGIGTTFILVIVNYLFGYLNKLISKKSDYDSEYKKENLN